MANAKQEKILIVGGAGYIGGFLSDLLAHLGYDITIYDNLTYESSYLKDIPFIFGDIRDQEKLGGLVNKFDIIIWLAALVGDPACAINPWLATDINYHSVDWLVKNFTGKVIFMSTCSVYGVNGALLDETAKTNPLSHYAKTKLMAEQTITNTSQNYLIFRLGTLHGLGDKHSRIRLDLVVNNLTKKATLGEPLTIYGGGQWRPFLHVKDVAQAIEFGLQNNITGLYNLSAENKQIREIAYEIKKYVPDAKTSFANMKFEDLRDYKVKSDKYAALGWQPKYSLAHGIYELNQLIKERRIKQPNDLLYHNAEHIKSKVI